MRHPINIADVEHWGVPRTSVDPLRLYETLDAARVERDLSWRGVAAEVGVSPSLLSRLRQGLRPDANGFAALVDWLGLPAENFFVREGQPSQRATPALSAQLAPLLRADKNFREEDVAYVTDVVRAMERRSRAQREP